MRKLEVFAGAYASGKSETALNRALQYVKAGKKITLVDLDTVEPAYTLRPLEKTLTEMGVNVITQPEYEGLGEAANYVNARQLNCLKEDGDIIIDVGYGASGLDILDIIENIDDEKNIEIFIVINTSKFETCSKENIIEYVSFAEGLEKRPWKKFSGIISNTHLGDETTKEIITKGYEIIKSASKELNIPIRAIGVPSGLKEVFDTKYDDIDIWFYERMMPKAFW